MSGRMLTPILAVLVCGACREPSGASKVIAPTTSGSETTSPDPQGSDVPCALDSDCQLVPSCSCDKCNVSKVMHVDPCDQPCAKDPCAAYVSACVAGTCAKKVTSASITCSNDADCSPPPCGPCASGTTITTDMMVQECVVNPCKNPDAACGPSHVCVVR